MRSLVSTSRRQCFANAVLLSNPDKISLCDTWLTNDHLNADLFLTDCCVYRREKTTQSFLSKHGGALIAIRSSVPHTFLDPNKLMTCSMDSFSDVIFCRISSSWKSFILVCFYNPPLVKWQPVLNIINLVRKDSEYVLLLGDTNMPSTD